MSYESMSQLENDSTFQQRQRACVIQQSENYKDDGRPDIAACAKDVLKLRFDLIQSFLAQAANGPGIGEKVDVGNGKIDQSLVTDADLLALTQAHFPVVAALYYKSDGTPL